MKTQIFLKVVKLTKFPLFFFFLFPLTRRGADKDPLRVGNGKSEVPAEQISRVECTQLPTAVTKRPRLRHPPRHLNPRIAAQFDTRYSESRRTVEELKVHYSQMFEEPIEEPKSGSYPLRDLSPSPLPAFPPETTRDMGNDPVQEGKGISPASKTTT